MLRDWQDVSKNVKIAVADEAEERLSTGTSSPYSLEMPITTKGDLDYLVLGDGKTTVPSQTRQIIENDVLLNPGNYDILEVVDQKNDEVKRKNYGETLPGLTVENINTRISLDREYEYAPILTVNAKDEDGNYYKMKVRIKSPSEIQAIAEDFAYTGNVHQYNVLSNRQLAMKVDTTYFNTEKGVDIDLIGATVNVKGVGDTWVVSAPGAAEEKLKSRDEVKDYLYRLQTILLQQKTSR